MKKQYSILAVITIIGGYLRFCHLGLNPLYIENLEVYPTGFT